MQLARYKKLSLAVMLSMGSGAPAMADVTYEGEAGTLSVGGDVELNINAYNEHEGGSSLFRTQSGERLGRDDRFNQDGRILIDINGDRQTSRHYARFKLQPLWNTSGDTGVDDAWFAVGSHAGSELKVGRFEAFDLFPLGQDVFVQYSGSTSNSLYSDGQSYVYQAREGRGRGDSGQIALSHQFGDTMYTEVATLFGDRSDLFDGDTYHGYDIEDDSKSAAIVRPVIAWTPESWTFAVGMEANLVNDSVIDERGEDIGDRTGYGARVSYGHEGLDFNLNFAHMEAHEESNSTVGVNTVWNNVGVGYIYAENDIDDVKPGASMKDITPAGVNKSSTLYSSYRFANVLGINQFDTYVGAYYSEVDHDNGATETDRYGARVRLKYLF